MNIFTTAVLLIVALSVNGDYLEERMKLLNLDYNEQIGHDIKLSSKEEQVDKILLEYKKKELDDSLKTGRNLQEKNFILVKDEIEKSDVFKIIKKMPKGAILHLHDLAMGSYDKILKKWTYDDRCYICHDSEKNKIKSLKIASEIPTDQQSDCVWKSVTKARSTSNNVTAFDAWIKSHITFTIDDVRNLKNQNEIWDKFINIFFFLPGLLGFHEAFTDYYKFSLEELLSDNIQYVELRATLPPLYFLNGTVTEGGESTFKEYRVVEDEVKSENPKAFFGAKYIMISLRSLEENVIKKDIMRAISLYEKYPTKFSGYDMGGQEDIGYSLHHFLDVLLLPKQLRKSLPYFFHAGETDFHGRSVDENLFDAFLLNTSRIGHGYALAKHPYLQQEIKSRGISIELCPISNQVLGLVADLRDHPATILMSEDQPITVSSDDPGIWGSSSLSHDLYEVVMGMVPEDIALKVLKKLALNSIQYSSLDDKEKAELRNLWQVKWDSFIDDVIAEHQGPREDL